MPKDVLSEVTEDTLASFPDLRFLVLEAMAEKKTRMVEGVFQVD